MPVKEVIDIRRQFQWYGEVLSCTLRQDGAFCRQEKAVPSLHLPVQFSLHCNGGAESFRVLYLRRDDDHYLCEPLMILWSGDEREGGKTVRQTAAEPVLRTLVRAQ